MSDDVSEAPPKTMLVTGGSRGIGAATARLAGAAGYAVCVNYASNAEAARAVVAAVEDAGGRAVAHRADVADPAQVRALFEAVDRDLGPLGVLVNNAGILETRCRSDEISAERLARVLAVNVTGAFLCAQAALRHMSRDLGGAGGAIVNVSSRAAVLGAAHEYVDYAASKGAVDSMTVGMAMEFAEHGVRVNAVRPGLIATDIHASGGMPDRVQRFASKVPMQRGGTAEEVAEAILWLASDASRYTTGAFIEVSGGR